MTFCRCTKCNRFGYDGIPCVKCGGVTARTPAPVSADVDPELVQAAKSFLAHCTKEYRAAFAAALRQPTTVSNKTIPETDSISVPRDTLLAWRAEWMENNPGEDGRDHVTPFDGWLM